MQLNRAMNIAGRVPKAMADAWAKGGVGRADMLRSFVSLGQNLEAMSVDFVRKRVRSQSLTDKYGYRSRARIKAEMCLGNEEECAAIVLNCHRRGGHMVRRDPNAPEVDSLIQFWVCLDTSGEIRDLLQDHAKMFMSASIDSQDAAHSILSGFDLQHLPCLSSKTAAFVFDLRYAAAVTCVCACVFAPRVSLDQCAGWQLAAAQWTLWAPGFPVPAQARRLISCRRARRRQRPRRPLRSKRRSARTSQPRLWTAGPSAN